MSLHLFAHKADKNLLLEALNSATIPDDQYKFHKFPSGNSTINQKFIQSIFSKIKDAERDILFLPADFYEVNVLELLMNIRMTQRDDKAKMKIVIYSIHSLFHHLQRHPTTLFYTSPNTLFLDLLELKDTVERLARIEEAGGRLMTNEEYEKLVQFMPDIPLFKENKSRHTLASQFGAYLMIDFTDRLSEKASNLGLSGEFPFLKNYKRRDQDTDIEELDAYLRQCLFAFKSNKSANSFSDSTKLELVLSSIQQIHRHSENGKIGLIDDEAQNIERNNKKSSGWLLSFQSVLFSEGSKNDIIEDVIEKCEINLEEISEKENLKHLCKQVKNNNYTCLLLDLKLDRKVKNEEEEQNIEDELGYKILQELKTTFPSLPVIMITSSNKPWRHRALIRAGADAVWVKEGVDENRSPKLSDINIIRLLKLIYHATGREYQFLKRIGKKIESIKEDREKYWWHAKELKWDREKYIQKLLQNNILKSDKKSSQEEKADSLRKHNVSAANLEDLKKQIPVLLNDILLLMKYYLRKTLLESKAFVILEQEPSESNNNVNVNFIAKSVIIQLGKIIELIHGQRAHVENFEDRVNSALMGARYVSIKGIIKRIDLKRGDWIGFFLYQFRNECAHYLEDVKYSFVEEEGNPRSLALVTSYALAYLSMKIQPFNSDNEYELRAIMDERSRKMKHDYISELYRRNDKTLKLKTVTIFKEIQKEILYGAKPDSHKKH